MNPPALLGMAREPGPRRLRALVLVVLLGIVAGSGLRIATTRGGAPSSPAAAAGGSARSGGIGVAAATVPGARPAGAPAAVDAAMAAPGPPPTIGEILGSRGLVRTVLVGRFVSTADVGALEELADTLHESKAMTGSLADAIFLRWTVIDPEGALAWTEGKGWLNPVVWAMAKSDPEAALAYGLEHNCAGNVVRSIAQGDPARGEALLAANPDLDGRVVWEGIASGLARSDSRAAALYALEHKIDTKDYIKRWAAEDPEEVLEFADGLKSPEARQELLAEGLATVAEEDVNEAFARAEWLPPGGMRARIVADLAADLSRTNPSAAAAKALALTSPFERDLALGMVGAVLATSDPDLAFKLVGQISFEGMRRYSGNVGYSYPRGSGSTNSSAWGSANGSALERAVSTLAASHPERTFDLLRDVPASDEIDDFVLTQAQRWVERAPKEASAWMATLPPGGRRDSMVAGLTSALSDGAVPDYESALAWAVTLEPGSNLHRRTLQRLFDKWTSHDEAAALAAMEREAAR